MTTITYDTMAAVEAASVPETTTTLRTAGYAEPGDAGAAFYKRASSEPSHEGKIQSEDGAWWELVSLRPTPQMFGARGDGVTDDTVPLRNWIEFGGDLYAPEGTYLVAAAGPDAGGVHARISASIRIEAHPNALFKAGKDLDNDVIRISADVSSYDAKDLLNVEWIGGKFDQIDQKNSTVIPYSDEYPGKNVGASATTDGLSIRGEVNDGGTPKAAFGTVKVSDTYFVSSPTGHWESAGGDGNLFIGGAVRMEVQGTRHVGARDAGVYISGLSSGTAEQISGFVENSVFEGSVFGATAKRYFSSVSLSNNTGFNTATLVDADDVTGGGKGVILEGNIAENAWVVAGASDTTAARIVGNISYNHGHVLEDGTAPTSIFNHNNAVVWAEGLTYSEISGNTVRGRDPASSFSTYTIRMDKNGSDKSQSNMVFSNHGYGVDGVVIEDDASANWNEYWENSGVYLLRDSVLLDGTGSINHDLPQWLHGSGRADTLFGDGRANLVWGGGGADRLYGRSDNDLLDGGPGNDLLDGGSGADALVGGPGIDRARYITADAGVVADLLKPDNNAGDAAGDSYSGIEDLEGSPHADALFGDAGANSLWGSGGNDSLFGGAGNDLLDGGSGADALVGGSGVDRAKYITADAGVRADLLKPDNNAGDAAGDSYSGIEDLQGSHHGDLLLGNDAANMIWGIGGSDSIYGRDGADRLLAGDGDDFLDGGAGDDQMSSGGGADTFLFALGSGGDCIDDFEFDTDTLVLNSDLWGGTTRSAQEVLESYGALRDSDAVLDFGGNDAVTLTGVGTLDFADDIQII